MASIRTETMVIEFNKLVKRDRETSDPILTSEQYEMIQSVIEAAIDEVLTDKSIVVEVSRTD